MPARIIFAIAVDPHFASALLEFRDPFQRPLQFVFPADDTHQILHHVLQVVLNLIGALALPVERFERLARHFIHLRCVDRARGVVFRELRGILTRALAEYHQIGERIPAQAIRAVQPRAALSGGDAAGDSLEGFGFGRGIEEGFGEGEIDGGGSGVVGEDEAEELGLDAGREEVSRVPQVRHPGRL